MFTFSRPLLCQCASGWESSRVQPHIGPTDCWAAEDWRSGRMKASIIGSETNTSLEKWLTISKTILLPQAWSRNRGSTDGQVLGWVKAQPQPEGCPTRSCPRKKACSATRRLTRNHKSEELTPMDTGFRSSLQRILHPGWRCFHQAAEFGLKLLHLLLHFPSNPAVAEVALHAAA
jgi:hypothetical protein